MISALLAFALYAQAAAAPETSPAPAPAPAPAADSPAAKPVKFGVVEGKRVEKSATVCLDDALSGSRIPKKRCMPREEFEVRQAEQRDYLKQVQRDARASASN